jgi:carbonic anhydrase/acetyltransferase-like protein (isoleucine patch superfamily)
LPAAARELTPAAWVAPNATLIGNVTLAAAATVFYGAVLRGDADRIVVGEGSNLQDGVVVHVDAGFPALVYRNVTVGHRAVLHGCVVQDGALIGMSATVLNGAVIGEGSLVAAGAVVLEGTIVPAGSLVTGVPGKIRRSVTEAEKIRIARGAAHYVDLAAAHAQALANATG